MTGALAPAAGRGSRGADSRLRSLLYLYCIVETGTDAAEALAERAVSGLEPNEPLFPIESGGLVAAVSQTRLDPQLPIVAGSGDQLKQVVLNLVLNARDAMPDGGTLTVTSRLSRATDRDFLAGQYVLLQVQDTGSSIPDDEMQHIFEPFYSTKQ